MWYSTVVLPSAYYIRPIIILAPAPSSSHIVTHNDPHCPLFKVGMPFELYMYEQVPWTVCNDVSFLEGLNGISVVKLLKVRQHRLVNVSS